MANDFIVNTQKHCFLCWNEIDHSFSHLNHSIQHLSNLLKLDRRKVLSENGAVPKQSVTKAVESRFMVKLCGGCATWNKSFSDKCRQLEKIRLEVFSKLNALQEVMQVGNDDQAERWSTNKYLDQNSNELRNHVMQRCAYMLRTDCPRVKIRKLTASELPTKRKIYSNPTHNMKLDAAIFKQNKEVAEEFTNDDFFNNLEIPEESPSPKEANAENEIDTKPNVFIPTPQTSNSTELTKFPTPALIRQLITTKPGRHECSICHKKFAHPRSFYNHAKSYHSHVRLKCRICYKDFTRKSVLRDHHRRWHKGECFIEDKMGMAKPTTPKPNISRNSVHVRYSCPLCPKLFAGRAAYKSHYRSAHIGIRHLCTGCNQTFSQAGHLRRHQQKSCGRQWNRKRK